MPSGVYPRPPKRVYQHVCKYCKAHFESESEDRQYCSRSCSSKHRGKPKVEAVCPNCDKQFQWKYPSKKQIYCSLSCSWQHNTQDFSAKRRIYRDHAQMPLSRTEIRVLKAELLEKQEHKCAICSNPVDMRSPLDHCHKTGKPREILCTTCNAAIGFMREDVEALRNAIRYLERHQ